MATLLLIHKLSVFLSILGFFVRGVGHLLEKSWVQKKVFKIAPHIIDTLLLVSAIGLLVVGPWGLEQSWIQAKILGLIAYIFFGVMAFKIAKTKMQKAVYWILALISVFYLVAVSKTQLVWPFVAQTAGV